MSVSKYTPQPACDERLSVVAPAALTAAVAAAAARDFVSVNAWVRSALSAKLRSEGLNPLVEREPVR